MNNFLIYLFSLCFIFISECKLYQSFVFFRHGARYHTNTIYDGNSTYPVRGQLTAIGMRQHQNLGKIIRKQYIEKIPLLNTKYNQSQVQIFSTRYDRTIQSGISFIFGLYPQGNGPKLPYVDRPYHLPPYISNKTDIDEQNYALPNAHQIVSLKFDDKVILKDCLNWDQLINKNFGQVTDVFDTLYVDRYLGRSLPPSLTQDDYKNLDHLNSWYYTFTISNNLSHLINTYKLKKIINQFQNRIRLINTYSTKMTIMSVHDTDIAALMTDLNLTSSLCIEQIYRKGSTTALNCQQNVGFASNLIIQLHSDDAISFYIKIRSDGKYMKLCQKQQLTCNYLQWRNRVRNIMLNNVEDLCKH